MFHRFFKPLLPVFSLAAVAITSAHAAEPALPALPAGGKVTHPAGSPLRSALRPVPESAIFKMDGWYLWDPSVVKVGDTWHLFVSRWPAAEKMKGWFHSHVIRATSKSLFGPYQFQEVVLHPSKHPWATQAIHNPKVMKIGNRYLIYHLGIPVWQTGFAWADSIEGPWQPVAKPVLSTNNPSILVRPDGSAYAVGKFKPKPTRDGEWDACMQAFEARSIDGPYRLSGGPGNRLPGNFELEDPVVWMQGGRYQVLCTDWESKATGIRKALVHYSSDDAVKYDLVSQVPVWSQTEPLPLANGGSLTVAGIERPQVVAGDNGDPIALLVSAYPEVKATAEKSAWPYGWLVNADHPAPSGRGTFTGRLLVDDPLKPAITGARAMVGLAAPETSHGNWQQQSKGYQYWTRVDDSGNFTIPAIRPGSYTLYAYTTGVVEEFSKTQITVTAGNTNSQGDLVWTVEHPGTSIAWEIGVPDRTAGEFRHGGDYFTPFLWDIYPQEFSNPLVYTVGSSNPATDWNYVHSNYPGSTPGTTTGWNWDVNFALPDVPACARAPTPSASRSPVIPASRPM